MVRGSIPIVMASADFSDILPPHSYIDAADFATPKDLAGFKTFKQYYF